MSENTSLRFSIRRLHVATYADGFTVWVYRDREARLDDVIVPGFFNCAGDAFNVGDWIMVSASDGGRILVVIQAGDAVRTSGLS